MNLADKPGVYKDFSGKIKWGFAVCVVRNADFEILEKKDENFNGIIFADAVFVSGEVWWSVIKNGLNLGCDFFRSDIKYMINRSGKFYNCVWHDGLFEGGIFKESWWHDGIWIKGEWDEGKNSKGKRMEFPPDKWRK